MGASALVAAGVTLGNLPPIPAQFADGGYYNGFVPTAVSDYVFLDAVNFYEEENYIPAWQVQYLKGWNSIPDAEFTEHWANIFTGAVPEEIAFSFWFEKKIPDATGWSAGPDNVYLAIQGKISRVELLGSEANSAVPEPGTYSLLGAACLAGLILLRGKRRRS